LNLNDHPNEPEKMTIPKNCKKCHYLEKRETFGMEIGVCGCGLDGNYCVADKICWLDMELCPW